MIEVLEDDDDDDDEEEDGFIWVRRTTASIERGGERMQPFIHSRKRKM